MILKHAVNALNMLFKTDTYTNFALKTILKRCLQRYYLYFASFQHDRFIYYRMVHFVARTIG